MRAIIFRVDSPGGSYVASDTIWRAVEQARAGGKPVIVTMGDVAASGGYFVAAPATKIVAQPGTITGSIGVISGKVVLTDMWAKLNVAWDGVQAGANADIESVNHDYSAAGWSRLEVALDHVYSDFMSKVGAGRNMPADRVRTVAKGQVWSGADAKGNGLVDELGGYMTALKLARQAANIPDDSPIDLVEFPQVDNSLTGLLQRLTASGSIGGHGAARAPRRDSRTDCARARAGRRRTPAPTICGYRCCSGASDLGSSVCVRFLTLINGP